MKQLGAMKRRKHLLLTGFQKPCPRVAGRGSSSGELFIVQARPETVQSQKEADSLKAYSLKQQGERLLLGLSIGGAIALGKVCRIKSAEDISRFQSGAVLVTEMTDPDWVPVMKLAAGIVTDHGGRTCHAAIVSPSGTRRRQRRETPTCCGVTCGGNHTVGTGLTAPCALDSPRVGDSCDRRHRQRHRGFNHVFREFPILAF